MFHGNSRVWGELGDLFAMLGIALLIFGFLTWLFSRIADADLLLFMGMLCGLLGIYYLLKADIEKPAGT
jgi:hypothetical protein